MEQVGQQLLKFKYSKKIFRRSWNSNSALAFGGYTSRTVFTSATEKYGMEHLGQLIQQDLQLARGYSNASSGTQTAALAFGGMVLHSILTATEEWDQGVTVPVAGSWSSGGNLNTARYQFRGTGTQTAALAFGGNTGLHLISYTASESYNGTSWTIHQIL
jgi:hypothetical protein